MIQRRDLTPLFEPKSVLLVGATADTLKWGGWVSKSFGDHQHLRDTHFVSLRGGELYGLPVHTAIADVAAGRVLTQEQSLQSALGDVKRLLTETIADEVGDRRANAAALGRNV